jgi:hypothetical protein
MDNDNQKTFFGSMYAPVALLVLVTLGVCLLGSNVADRRSAAAKVPDVIATYQSCEYRGETAVMVAYQVWEYLSTSCGDFTKPLKKYELEKGKFYDIETTRSATNGVHISKVTLSTKPE